MASLPSQLSEYQPTIQRWTLESPSALKDAEALVIADDAGFVDAGRRVQATSAAVKAIGELFKKPKQSIDQSKKDILAVEKALVDGFERADAILRAKMAAFHTAREQARRESDQMAQAAERKRAEDRQIAEAVRLDALGKTTGDPLYAKAAERVISRPTLVPLVKSAPVLKAAGISTTDKVSITVDDLVTLVEAVVRGEVPYDAVCANEAWLKGEAKQRGDAFSIPGVTRHVSTGLTVRT